MLPVCSGSHSVQSNYHSLSFGSELVAKGGGSHSCPFPVRVNDDVPSSADTVARIAMTLPD